MEELTPEKEVDAKDYVNEHYEPPEDLDPELNKKYQADMEYNKKWLDNFAKGIKPKKEKGDEMFGEIINNDKEFGFYTSSMSGGDMQSFYKTHDLEPPIFNVHYDNDFKTDYYYEF